jgi:hypothetical protein
MYVCMYVCVYIYIHYVYIYTYTYIHIDVDVHRRPEGLCPEVCIRTYIHTCIHAYVYSVHVPPHGLNLKELRAVINLFRLPECDRQLGSTFKFEANL